jgi:hypothetical protein
MCVCVCVCDLRGILVCSPHTPVLSRVFPAPRRRPATLRAVGCGPGCGGSGGRPPSRRRPSPTPWARARTDGARAARPPGRAARPGRPAAPARGAAARGRGRGAGGAGARGAGRHGAPMIDGPLRRLRLHPTSYLDVRTCFRSPSRICSRTELSDATDRILPSRLRRYRGGIGGIGGIG